MHGQSCRAELQSALPWQRALALRLAWSEVLGRRGGSMRRAVKASQSKPCKTKTASMVAMPTTAG